jgi:hypothetical protein
MRHVDLIEQRITDVDAYTRMSYCVHNHYANRPVTDADGKAYHELAPKLVRPPALLDDGA